MSEEKAGEVANMVAASRAADRRVKRAAKAAQQAALERMCEIDGVTYVAVRWRCMGNGCSGCAAEGYTPEGLALCHRLPWCLRGMRRDKRDVVWVRREVAS